MKKVKMFILLFLLSMSLFVFKGKDVKSADIDNVNINVPTRMDIVFHEDGTTSVSDMYLENNSIVPIVVRGINITEFNEWEVVPESEVIQVNCKKMSLHMGAKELTSGSNVIEHEVTDGTKYDLDITVKRGAWTKEIAQEKALEIDLEYETGTKIFALTLDGNGGSGTTVVYAENGSTVVLETPTREGYKFNGWKDSEGNVYSDAFVMPIGDTTLTARWEKEVAYALYIASDSSLRFVRTTESLYDGCTYNGMTVTKVYKGFENASYSSVSNVPWYDGSSYNNRIIKQVIVQDKIQPVSTAYWFANMCDCEYLNLSLLDTSKTTNMSRMFMRTGMDVTANVRIYGVDEFDTSNVTNMSSMFEYTGQYASSVSVNLSKWNVSNVTNMNRMFIGMGYRSKVFSLGNLSDWDVSNVTNMDEMFKQAGFRVTWSVDCSGWNVSKVTSANDFKYQAESKVTEPNWVF